MSNKTLFPPIQKKESFKGTYWTESLPQEICLFLRSAEARNSAMRRLTNVKAEVGITGGQKLWRILQSADRESQSMHWLKLDENSRG